MLYPNLLYKELWQTVKLLDAVYKKEEAYRHSPSSNLKDQIEYLRLQRNAIDSLLDALQSFEKEVASYLRDVDYYVKDLLRSLRGSKDKDASFTRQAIRELGEDTTNKAAKLAKIGILLKQEGLQIAREE